jgi:hypothetical protein
MIYFRPEVSWTFAVWSQGRMDPARRFSSGTHLSRPLLSLCSRASSFTACGEASQWSSSRRTERPRRTLATSLRRADSALDFSPYRPRHRLPARRRIRPWCSPNCTRNCRVLEPQNPGMHTTDTVDFDVIVSGEVFLELDDGSEVLLKAGDCVVQNGTRHAWAQPVFSKLCDRRYVSGRRTQPLAPEFSSFPKSGALPRAP